MKVIKIENKYDMLIKIIELALLLKLPSKYSLLPREKEFLANSILLSNEGVLLEGSEMVTKICKQMEVKKADVYNYRNILKKKGWLMQTATGFELISFLDFSKKKIPSNLNINYNLKIE
jgi:hypothetical protein